MRFRQCFFSCLLCAMLAAVVQVQPEVAASETAPSGTLMICGGGALPRSIIERFVELAGGEQGRLVVVTTAASDSGLPDPADVAALWKMRGVPQVSVLHTRDRARADDPKFAEDLREATAVWMNGGQQSRLARAYVGTKVELQIRKLLQRGGVVGGTSAGAAIQSQVMIRGGRQTPAIGVGLDLVPGAIIDQHFLRRSRVNRLMHAVREHPQRIGIGIDEKTAICVSRGTAEVLGESYVVVVTPPDDSAPIQLHCYSGGQAFPLQADQLRSKVKRNAARAPQGIRP